jgi:hypothetical protein
MSISMTHEDPEKCFGAAVASGSLSTDTTAENFIGRYLYVCTYRDGHDSVDYFKNIKTRSGCVTVMRPKQNQEDT